MPEVSELLAAYDAQLRDHVPDSRPILERLGFNAVTTTTPYVWSPPTATIDV
jgi:hypothetical protein